MTNDNDLQFLTPEQKQQASTIETTCSPGCPTEKKTNTLYSYSSFMNNKQFEDDGY